VSPLRRGAYDGLVVGAAIVAAIVVIQFVGPVTNGDGTTNPVGYLLVAGALGLVGWRAAGGSRRRYAGAVAGAVAAGIITALTMTTFAVLDGMSPHVPHPDGAVVVAILVVDSPSIRGYLDGTRLVGLAVLPAVVLAGAVLGYLGARLRRYSAAG
jgi:outer membrane lipoprotein SlyB